MKTLQSDTLGDISFSLNWEKNGICHEDTYFGHRVNVWQDYFPGFVAHEILNKHEGFSTKLKFSPGEAVPDYNESLLKTINISQLDVSRLHDGQPAKGRFYPKGIINDISGIYKQNITPFRFIDQNSKTADVDFNHPFSGIEARLKMAIQNIHQNDRKFGGTCSDWIDQLVTGPGMQTRYGTLKTDFFNENTFKRNDSTPDDIFYQKDRMVHHIDAMSQTVLQNIYRRRLKKDTVVLDLMASWQSHLPDDIQLKHVDGLGMNKNELSANQRLSAYVVHDLNQHPVLPYPADRFDAVICSLSVEYLIRPFDVFNETARVLKPGGLFVITFSNRWFPPKAIDIWKHIHEFERLALVTKYFLESGRFENIQTLSRRGFPRPSTDKYFPGKKEADPIYMVSGICK